MKVSAVIIAFNEEKNIADAIRGVGWADEVLVIDSESTDATRSIAKELGARVIVQPWLGFAAQKQFAANAAEHDWIFSLDADERISDPLREELLRTIRGNRSADGYRIPRLTFYMDRPVRHGGWYPDRQLRFFDRTKGKWKAVKIHESFRMNADAKTGTLSGDILHYSVENAAHHHRMIGERYAPLAAEQMFEDGRRTSPMKIVFAGPTAFFRTYLLRLGFLDGLAGFAIAKFAAHHAFLKNLLLWEKQRVSSPHASKGST